MVRVTANQATILRQQVIDTLPARSAQHFAEQFPTVGRFSDFMEYSIVDGQHMPDTTYHVPAPYSIPDDELDNYMAVMADIRS